MNLNIQNKIYQFTEKINKIETSLARLIKIKKKGEAKINKIINNNKFK